MLHGEEDGIDEVVELGVPLSLVYHVDLYPFCLLSSVYPCVFQHYMLSTGLALL